MISARGGDGAVSASAIVPALRAEVELAPLTASLFTSAVQAGFVIGTLASAVLGLADRLDPRRFFMTAALVAATDSAQFSASIAELSEPSHVGTLLTIQTSMGSLLTLLTIHLNPPLVAAMTWRLRRHPDGTKLAG
jgi:hypothetical protein